VESTIIPFEDHIFMGESSTRDISTYDIGPTDAIIPATLQVCNSVLVYDMIAII
jgi:hypothetical protein